MKQNVPKGWYTLHYIRLFMAALVVLLGSVIRPYVLHTHEIPNTRNLILLTKIETIKLRTWTGESRWTHQHRTSVPASRGFHYRHKSSIETIKKRILYIYSYGKSFLPFWLYTDHQAPSLTLERNGMTRMTSLHFFHHHIYGFRIYGRGAWQRSRGAAL